MSLYHSYGCSPALRSEDHYEDRGLLLWRNSRWLKIKNLKRNKKNQNEYKQWDVFLRKKKKFPHDYYSSLTTTLYCCGTSVVLCTAAVVQQSTAVCCCNMNYLHCCCIYNPPVFGWFYIIIHIMSQTAEEVAAVCVLCLCVFSAAVVVAGVKMKSLVRCWLKVQHTTHPLFGRS